MQVETYECEETAAESPERDEEALGLIERLGLEGQKSLLSPSERIPYRQMLKEEMFVFGMHCPRKTKLEDYGDEPIPLRVLQVAAHARGLEFFDEIWVWHRDSASVVDPVLVGNKKVQYREDHYILARWGVELAPYVEMAEQAMKLWRDKTREKLALIIRDAKCDVETIDMATIETAANNPGGSTYYGLH